MFGIIGNQALSDEDNLFVESLERRLMLSAVKVFAAGHTGEENLTLIAGAETVTFEQVGGDIGNRQFVTLEFDTDQQLSTSDIEILFTNDHFDPATGKDRNLTVERIEVDGVATYTSEGDVYTEGAYVGANMFSGYGGRDTLYSNGRFVFGAPSINASNLTVYAKGTTDEEQFEVLVGDKVVGRFQMDSSSVFRNYSLAYVEKINGSDVSVRFINDLYLPEQGIDRNLIVDRIVLDGVSLETESPEVFSTGTWVEGVGIQPGNPQSEVLHANGEFVYFDVSTDGFPFAGRTWYENDPAIVNIQFDDLRITTEGGLGVISTDFNIVDGERYTLRASIVRRGDVEEAYLGVDYLDSNGNEIGEQVFTINTGFPFVDGVLNAPAGTARGVIWVAVLDAGDRTATVNFNDLQLTQVNAGDNSPPEIEFLDEGFVLTEPVTEIRLNARYTDNVELSFNPGILNARRLNSDTRRGAGVTFANGGTATMRDAEITYSPPGFFAPFTSADNGVYELLLVDGTLIDANGNTAPGGVIGSFTINIPPENG